MKKYLFFMFIALLSAPFLNAQQYRDYWDSIKQINLNKDLLSNEEFFDKSELIIEGKFQRYIETYDAKGNYNPDDIYQYQTILVQKVFKGDPALAGATIWIIKKGGVVYSPPGSKWGDPDREAIYSHSEFYPGPTDDGGLRISQYYSSILFFVKSDYPDNPDMSKVDLGQKYKPLQNKEKASLEFWGDGRIGGLNNLIFNNRAELYQYMSRFSSITIPKEIEPERARVRIDNTPFVPSSAVNYSDLDSVMRARIIRIKDSIEKKMPDNPKSSKTTTTNNTLTTEITNQNMVYDENTNKFYLEFDLLASSNNPDIYLFIIWFDIAYNPVACGSNLLSSNKTISIVDSAFSNNYQITHGYESDSSFEIGFIVKYSSQSLPLSSVPTRVLHVKVELLPNLVNVLSGLVFKQPQTSGFYTMLPDLPWGQTLKEYDVVYLVNSPSISLTTIGHPAITTNLSAISKIAGNGEVLTINGNNFGNVKGKVRFASADEGATVLLNDLDDQYYISWNDTEIKVIVPSLVFKGYENDDNKKYRGGAGSGQIQIHTAWGDSCRSATSLNIPYSYVNTGNPDDFVNNPIKRVWLAKLDCNYDFVFTLSANMQGNTAAITAIEHALNKWSSLLNISIVLERDSNGNLVYSPLVSQKNDKNLIDIVSDLPGLAIMSTSSNYAVGILSPVTYYRKHGSNILIRSTPNFHTWNYNLSGTTPAGTISFYQAFLHEVGHIVLLGHVTNSSDLMYYNVQSNHPIIDIDSTSVCVQAAANTVTLSQNIVWLPLSRMMTLGAVPNINPNITVNDTVRPPVYVSNPSGGMPPYSYLWEQQATGFLCSSFSIQYAQSNSIPVSFGSSSCPLKLTVTDYCGNQVVTTQMPANKKAQTTDDEIAIYPNPSNGLFHVNGLNNNQSYRISATNLLGQTVIDASSIQNDEINLTQHADGVYFVKIATNNNCKVLKVVKY